jgi:hypothetical protein
VAGRRYVHAILVDSTHAYWLREDSLDDTTLVATPLR